MGFALRTYTNHGLVVNGIAGALVHRPCKALQNTCWVAVEEPTLSYHNNYIYIYIVNDMVSGTQFK